MIHCVYLSFWLHWNEGDRFNKATPKHLYSLKMPSCEMFPTVGGCGHHHTSVLLAPLRKPPATKTQSPTDETASALETLKTNIPFNNNCRYYWSRWHVSPVTLSYCPVLNLDATNLNNARKSWLTGLSNDARYYYYRAVTFSFPVKNATVQTGNVFNCYTDNK